MQSLDQLADTGQIADDDVLLELDRQPVAAHVELTQTVADPEHGVRILEGILGERDEEAQVLARASLLGDDLDGRADGPLVQLLDQPLADGRADEVLGFEQILVLVEQAQQDAVVLLVVAHQTDDGLVDQFELIVAQGVLDLARDRRLLVLAMDDGFLARAIAGVTVADAEPVRGIDDVLGRRGAIAHQEIADLTVGHSGILYGRPRRQAGLGAQLGGQRLSAEFIESVDDEPESVLAHARQESALAHERAERFAELVEQFEPDRQAHVVHHVENLGDADEEDGEGTGDEALFVDMGFDLGDQGRESSRPTRAVGSLHGRLALRGRLDRLEDQTQTGFALELARRGQQAGLEAGRPGALAGDVEQGRATGVGRVARLEQIANRRVMLGSDEIEQRRGQHLVGRGMAEETRVGVVDLDVQAVLHEGHAGPRDLCEPQRVLLALPQTGVERAGRAPRLPVGEFAPQAQPQVLGIGAPDDIARARTSRLAGQRLPLFRVGEQDQRDVGLQALVGRQNRVDLHVPIIAAAEDQVTAALGDHPVEMLGARDRETAFGQARLAEHRHQPLGLTGLGGDDEQRRLLTGRGHTGVVRVRSIADGRIIGLTDHKGKALKDSLFEWALGVISGYLADQSWDQITGQARTHAIQ